MFLCDFAIEFLAALKKRGLTKGKRKNPEERGGIIRLLLDNHLN
jgi:hypothetical protein